MTLNSQELSIVSPYLRRKIRIVSPYFIRIVSPYFGKYVSCPLIFLILGRHIFLNHRGTEAQRREKWSKYGDMTLIPLELSIVYPYLRRKFRGHNTHKFRGHNTHLNSL